MKIKGYGTIFLGFLMVFSILLVNLGRTFVPRKVTDFHPHFLLFLFFFYLSFLILFGLYVLWRKKYTLNLLSFSSLDLLLPFLGRSPKDFYEFLEKKIPPSPYFLELRWKMVQKLSPLSHSFYSFLFFMINPLPRFIPPTIFILEFYFSQRIHFFYYSLLLLWFPLLSSFFIFLLREYVFLVRNYLEKFFTLSTQGKEYHLRFHRESPHNSAQTLNWYVFIRFQNKLDHWGKLREKYSSFILLFLSFLYLLAWTQILLSHPHFQLSHLLV